MDLQGSGVGGERDSPQRAARGQSKHIAPSDGHLFRWMPSRIPAEFVPMDKFLDNMILSG